MGFEDFTAYEAARREVARDPIGFALYGEDFECEPEIGAGALLDFTLRLHDDQAGAVTGLLEQILTPEAWERFRELLRDRSRPVSIPTLVRIIEALTEQYAGRPTAPSGSSSPTPLRVGKNSKPSSSPRAKARRSA